MNNKNIANFYEIALLVDDDIEIVAYLIGVFKLQKNNKIIRDLEVLNLHSYEDILESILDLKLRTVLELAEQFRIMKDKPEVQKVKKVDNTTNIFDFIGDDNEDNIQEC
jgi:hypothetical protein